MASLELGTRSLNIGWSDDHSSTFHYLWLRDNCPQLRHPQTNHRIHETSTIASDVKPVTAVITIDGDLQLTWPDAHVSTYSATWLKTFDYSSGRRRTKRKPILWDGNFAPSVPLATYPALQSDKLVRVQWLRSFCDYGVAILTEVPNVSGTVLELGNSLGEVRSTHWGKIFDVKSIADANSLAYTNLPLVLHTDEAYRDPTPTVQLQHFLVCDSIGGEATLVDGFKVADDLRTKHPSKFELLATTSLHFHFRDADIEIENDGPIIELDTDGEVRYVRFSNHSVQPFLLPADKMEAFYDAYSTFGEMRESPRYRIQMKMNAGDMYMVDNRRVMHGRTGFTEGGARHLQSCYIERDELLGRLAVLEREIS
ncbi:MAG: TauD/TfdA family dioxygenase [Ilumatobacteraceae bacterium]